MSKVYQNITGSSAIIVGRKTSMSDGDVAYDPIEKSLEESVIYTNFNICNIHASDSVSVDLYAARTYIADNESRQLVGEDGNWNALAETTDTYYILKGMLMPAKSTLNLNENEVFLDTTLYDLYIKLSASDSAVDLIINTSGGNYETKSKDIKVTEFGKSSTGVSLY